MDAVGRYDELIAAGVDLRRLLAHEDSKSMEEAETKEMEEETGVDLLPRSRALSEISGRRSSHTSTEGQSMTTSPLPGTTFSSSLR